MKHRIEIGETDKDFFNGTYSIRVDGIIAKEAEVLGGGE